MAWATSVGIHWEKMEAEYNAEWAKLAYLDGPGYTTWDRIEAKFDLRRKYYSGSSSHGVQNSIEKAPTQSCSSHFISSMAESNREHNSRMAETARKIRESCARILKLLQEEMEATKSSGDAVPTSDEILLSVEGIDEHSVTDESVQVKNVIMTSVSPSIDFNGGIVDLPEETTQKLRKTPESCVGSKLDVNITFADSFISEHLVVNSDVERDCYSTKVTPLDMDRKQNNSPVVIYQGVFNPSNHLSDPPDFVSIPPPPLAPPWPHHSVYPITLKSPPSSKVNNIPHYLQFEQTNLFRTQSHITPTFGSRIPGVYMLKCSSYAYTNIVSSIDAHYLFVKMSLTVDFSFDTSISLLSMMKIIGQIDTDSQVSSASNNLFHNYHACSTGFPSSGLGLEFGLISIVGSLSLSTDLFVRFACNSGGMILHRTVNCHDCVSLFYCCHIELLLVFHSSHDQSKLKGWSLLPLLVVERIGEVKLLSFNPFPRFNGDVVYNCIINRILNCEAMALQHSFDDSSGNHNAYSSYKHRDLDIFQNTKISWYPHLHIEGENEFQIIALNKFEEKNESKFLKFFGFMWNPLSWVVEVALANGGEQPPDWQDFVAIVCLLVINSTISFREENNVGNVVAALMAGLAPKTKVLRHGMGSDIDKGHVILLAARAAMITWLSYFVEANSSCSKVMQSFVPVPLSIFKLYFGPHIIVIQVACFEVDAIIKDKLEKHESTPKPVVSHVWLLFKAYTNYDEMEWLIAWFWKVVRVVSTNDQYAIIFFNIALASTLRTRLILMGEVML
ncbi:uncharacterized protein LOC131611956 [Vicia villosa]|uniref:uncharacterized protein LOC131611956 n=1 Tax=Vicia villosa TaxID=3911 RepID=UPI00273C8187|nr:uncharacterized protein LOC131611956 [Vicia villosa]